MPCSCVTPLAASTSSPWATACDSWFRRCAQRTPPGWYRLRRLTLLSSIPESKRLNAVRSICRCLSRGREARNDVSVLKGNTNTRAGTSWPGLPSDATRSSCVCRRRHYTATRARGRGQRDGNAGQRSAEVTCPETTHTTHDTPTTSSRLRSRHVDLKVTEQTVGSESGIVIIRQD